jgi:hypothetical protein
MLEEAYSRLPGRGCQPEGIFQGVKVTREGIEGPTVEAWAGDPVTEFGGAMGNGW